jgi:hypothetical protein
VARSESKEAKSVETLVSQFSAQTAPMNNMIDNWLHFHYARHKKNPKTWTPVGNLDAASSLYWCAYLIDNLATNTLNVMKAIMAHDKIIEEDLWPDPRPLDTTDTIELLRTIGVWIKMDEQIFQALNSFYPLPDYAGYNDNTPAPVSVHDALQKLAVQAIDFITAENTTYSPRIKVTPILGTPVDGIDNNTIIPSLQSIELGFHRLIQEHMQIASFIPKHLTVLIKELKAKGDFNIFLK